MSENGRGNFRNTEVSWLAIFTLIRREITEAKLVNLQVCSQWRAMLAITSLQERGPDAYTAHISFLQSTLHAFLNVFQRVVCEYFPLNCCKPRIGAKRRRRSCQVPSKPRSGRY